MFRETTSPTPFITCSDSTLDEQDLWFIPPQRPTWSTLQSSNGVGLVAPAAVRGTLAGLNQPCATTPRRPTPPPRPRRPLQWRAALPYGISEPRLQPDGSLPVPQGLQYQELLPDPFTGSVVPSASGHPPQSQQMQAPLSHDIFHARTTNTLSPPPRPRQPSQWRAALPYGTSQPHFQHEGLLPMPLGLQQQALPLDSFMGLVAPVMPVHPPPLSHDIFLPMTANTVSPPRREAAYIAPGADYSNVQNSHQEMTPLLPPSHQRPELAVELAGPEPTSTVENFLSFAMGPVSQVQQFLPPPSSQVQQFLPLPSPRLPDPDCYSHEETDAFSGTDRAFSIAHLQRSSSTNSRNNAPGPQVQEFRRWPCNESFGSQPQHRRTVHEDGKPFACSRCLKRFRTIRMREGHLLAKRACRVKQAQFFKTAEGREAARLGNEYACSKCNQSFDPNERHICLHEERFRFHCYGGCGRQLASKNDLLSHWWDEPSCEWQHAISTQHTPGGREMLNMLRRFYAESAALNQA